MGQFYLLSEVITPVMAWGFLGTDSSMKQHCLQLKASQLPRVICDSLSSSAGSHHWVLAEGLLVEQCSIL